MQQSPEIGSGEEWIWFRWRGYCIVTQKSPLPLVCWVPVSTTLGW